MSVSAMFRCLLLLAALLHSGYAGATREPERHQVVVVGAGVSGFTAASTLLEHNVTDLIVLEASDRIGGRIHTVTFGGVPIDKGAEFVHGEVDNAVFELVSPYDLLASYSTLKQNDKFLFADIHGHVFNSTRVKGLVDEGFGIPNEEGLKHVNGSLGDYFYHRLDEMLSAENVEPEMKERLSHLLAQLLSVYTGSGSLEEQGGRGYTESVENEGDLQLKWKKGGYKTIFDFISKKFPKPEEELPVVNKTVFGKQVTRVERRETDVLVTCADGSTYLTNHVIITVSLGVLKKHAADMFQPALPDKKTAAIESLGIGCVGKVFMVFPDRWWTNDTNLILPLFTHQELQDFRSTSVHGSWSSNTTGFHPVMNHDRMLCSWFTGQACRTMGSIIEQEVTDGLVELLEKIVGQRFNISKPEAILRTQWASNPYTLGAYSYSTVASDSQNITRNDLAQSVLDTNGKPVILFAGEATHPHYTSMVHGALATGRREAQNLLNYIQKRSS